MPNIGVRLRGALTRRSRATRRRAGVAAGAILAVTAAGLAIMPANAATTTAPTATVAQGTLQGTVKNGADAYLGVPYAAPPTGALRWKPPQPAAPWTGTRKATRAGSQCPQSQGLAVTTTANEDCLYANIYVPAKPSATPRPVMVWIHGGGYYIGSGIQYDESVFAVNANAIVVTFNYRLGPLGFLALPSLAAESPDHASGDYGLMDQQAAFRWVQQNAAAFGGDPHDMTIFGESAGGGSVCEQVASPTAAGLFQHAIAESGCALPAPTQAQADATGAAFAQKLGCTDPATAATCLRGKSARDIINASGEQAAVPTQLWFPAVGGSVEPEQVLDAFRAGHVNKVDLIDGTNHDEGTFMTASQYAFTGLPNAKYNDAVASHFGSIAAPAIIAEYPLSKGTAMQQLSAAITDAAFSCPAYAADAAVSAYLPTYAYEFSDPHPAGYIPGIPGAGHGSEIQYLTHRYVALDWPISFSPAQAILSQQMTTYWAAFAATGNPNGAAAVTWPPFTPTAPHIHELVPPGTKPPAKAFLDDHHCSFWTQLEATVPVNMLP